MQYPSTISQVTDDNEQYGFFGKVGPSLPNSHDVWLFFGYNQHLCFKLLQEFHKITTFRDIRQSAFAVSVQCYVTDVHSHSVLLLMLLSSPALVVLPTRSMTCFEFLYYLWYIIIVCSCILSFLTARSQRFIENSKRRYFIRMCKLLQTFYRHCTIS